jgi:hypothetical protein
MRDLKKNLELLGFTKSAVTINRQGGGTTHGSCHVLDSNNSATTTGAY